jgi:hypothetical protein
VWDYWASQSGEQLVQESSAYSFGCLGRSLLCEKLNHPGGSGICRARRARVSAVQDVVNDKRELGQGIGGGIGGKLAERPQVPFTA